MLLVALSNILPVWVFAQRRSHAFSSRDFHFDYSPKKARRPVIKAQTLADAFQVDITIKPAICSEYTGLIIVQATGGTPPYSYQMDNGNWQYSGIFGSGDGETRTINVKDATGAIVSTTAVVTSEENAPTATVTQVDPSCGGMDGSLTINNPSGGTPPYTYSLDKLNWQSGTMFSNLAPGWYNVYMRDAKGCVHQIFTFPTGCVGMGLGGSGATCGGSDGSINMEIHDYYPPYTYSMDGTNYQSTGYFTGLTAGVKLVYIKDGRGKVFLYAPVLVYYCGLEVQGTVTNADCGATNGVITAAGANGTPPYRYSIDGVHFQSGNMFTGLAPGLYTVMITDATNNYQLAPVQVGDNCPTITVYTMDANCGANDGELTAIGGNGTPPYTYSIGGAYTPNPQFSGVPAGTYTVTIKDADGHTAATTATVNNTCLHVSVTPGDATCGRDDGTIDITVADGTPPYHYSIDGGGSYQTDPHFPDVAPGTYAVAIYDAVNNRTTVNTTVDAAPLPTLTVTPVAATCADNDGSLVIAGVTGVAPYQYALDGGDYTTDGTLGHVSSGSHQVYVKDANGCIAGRPVNVPLNDNLTVDGGPPIQPICEGKTAVIKAASNGTTFSWQPATGLDNPHILQPTASPAVSTTYTLTALLGACQKTATVDVPVNPAPVAAAKAGENICAGKSTQLHAIGPPDYRYSWTPTAYLDDPASANPTVSGLTQATTFHLTVKDANGCQSQNTADVIISLTPPPRVSAGSDTSILLGQALPLHAIDVDNVGLGDWVWTPSEGLDNDGIANPIARPEQRITYTVTGFYNECPGSARITVTVYTASGIFVPNAFTPNGDGNNDMLRPILVGIKELKYFAVFDRWGQRVFYTTNAAEGWRGHSNGQDQPMGTYVWMAGGVDLRGTFVQQKGTVLLIR